ncbi:MAG: HepT-like ribonuclease domain-containing protein [Pseudomonadota bacterium]
MARIDWNRNRLAHGYFGINNEILWRVVEVETPKLYKALENIRQHRPELFKGQA